jgi:serine/threonine-protein kinase
LGPTIETYELELALRGTSAAIQAFLKDGGKLQVAVKAKDNLGQELFFSNFAIDKSHTRLKSNVSTASPVLTDRPLDTALYPRQTDSVVLGLMPEGLKLGRHMEAELTIELIGAGALAGVAPFDPVPQANKPADQGPPLAPDQRLSALKPSSGIAGAPPQGALSPERIERIVRYVEQYDGGDCFFVAPAEVTETTARLEGYGASPRPFETLNDAFEHANGYEPTIDVRLVTPPQCPAVTFLGRLRGVSAPRLRIDAARLRPREPLTGAVDGYGGWNLELLLATDLGNVQNVSHLFKPDVAGKTFTIKLADIGAASAGQPQLLIALATLRPFELLRFDHAVTADRLFPAVLSEAAGANQPIAAMARYFKLEQ